MSANDDHINYLKEKTVEIEKQIAIAKVRLEKSEQKHKLHKLHKSLIFKVRKIFENSPTTVLIHSVGAGVCLGLLLAIFHVA